MVPLGLAVAYVALAAAIWAGQRAMLFIPDTTRPVLPADVAGAREVELVTPDGVRLLAWYVPGRPGQPVLAYFHGNGGSLGNRAARLRRFAAEGWGVLMPEYRGYGGNPGAPSEEGFALDAQAALAFLAGEGVGADRLVLYGESIGTGVAVRAAADWAGANWAIAALVLESPYASVTDLARRRFPFLPVGLLLRDPFDSLSRIGRVRAPLLVLQGGRDGIVPPDSGRTLFDAAMEPKEMWMAAQGGHNDLIQFGLADAVIGFVRRMVRP